MLKYRKTRPSREKQIKVIFKKTVNIGRNEISEVGVNRYSLPVEKRKDITS